MMMRLHLGLDVWGFVRKLFPPSFWKFFNVGEGPVTWITWTLQRLELGKSFSKLLSPGVPPDIAAENALHQP
jgi:hypothetical protein